jgi:hypothetical protein
MSRSVLAALVWLATLVGLVGCSREVEPRSASRIEPLGVGGGWVREPDPEIPLDRAPRPKLSHTVVIRDAFAWDTLSHGAAATPVVALGQNGRRGVSVDRGTPVHAPAPFGWTGELAPPRVGAVALPPRAGTGAPPAVVAPPPRASGGGPTGGGLAPPGSSPSRVPGLR